MNSRWSDRVKGDVTLILSSFWYWSSLWLLSKPLRPVMGVAYGRDLFLTQLNTVSHVHEPLMLLCARDVSENSPKHAFLSDACR